MEKSDYERVLQAAKKSCNEIVSEGWRNKDVEQLRERVTQRLLGSGNPDPDPVGVLFQTMTPDERKALVLEAVPDGLYRGGH